MEVLVTGGAGYIGSTICSALVDNGHKPIILDSFVTGSKLFSKNFPTYESDIADPLIVEKIREDFPNCKSIVHCAARIIVGESVLDPYLYFAENVSKTIEFFHNSILNGFDKIIFSSSASVYGVTDKPGVTEEFSGEPMSPYAHSKLMMEKILSSYCTAYQVKGISLRYFNPIGADPKLRSGMVKDGPSHILGRLLDTMSGKYDHFEIFGDDWPTRDGFAIRDYIHVWDLALAHVKALEFLNSAGRMNPHEVLNIGTGTGTTVKEFCDAFQELAESKISLKISARRDGDVVGSYAVTEKAQTMLRWKSEKSISDGIRDSMAWMEKFLNE